MAVLVSAVRWILISHETKAEAIMDDRNDIGRGRGMTRAFPALALRAIGFADVRSAIHGSAVERRLLAKAPVLILPFTNNKNVPRGPVFVVGRGRGIRTPDIQLPKLALYQTELYPDASPARHGRKPAMVRPCGWMGQRAARGLIRRARWRRPRASGSGNATRRSRVSDSAGRVCSTPKPVPAARLRRWRRPRPAPRR